MKEYTAFLLHFTSPLHIGNSREDYGSSMQTLGSDGIYAAITSALAAAGLDIPEDGNLGCTVSSLFPFCQMEDGDKPLLFFPRPKSVSLPQMDIGQAKRIKKVEWLDKESFEVALSGNDPFHDGDVYGKYLTARGQCFTEDFMQSAVMQRVSIIDVSRHDPPTPFYLDRILFRGRSGLFFLCEGDTKMVEQALALLGESGIGSCRSVGNGFFDYESCKIAFNAPDDAPMAVSLSTYIPTSREELNSLTSSPQCAYELLRMGGWCTTIDGKPLRRNPVHGFAAGSVFTHTGSSVKGAIVDQRPAVSPHPVYRCGRALFLPYKPYTI